MSDETVRCDFQVGGISQAKEAYRTIEQSLARLEKLAAKHHDADERGTLRVAKAQHEAGAQAVKSAAQFADARAEIAKRSAQKRRDTETTLLADLDKLEKAHTKTVEGEHKKREQSAARAAAAEAKAVDRRRSQMGAALTGGLGRGVGRPISGAMQYGGMALAMGGGFALADAMKGYASSEAAAIGLANSMYSPNGEEGKEQASWLAKNGKNGRFDKKKLMDLAGATSASTGVDKTALLSGWQSYVAKSSDWKALATQEGQGTMTDLAKLATATGTDFGQLMNAAGMLRVQNPDLKPEQMSTMMRNIVGQGKMGAVEITDLAQHASVITANSSKYKVGEGGYKDQAAAQNALLGLSQIAIRTSGSAAEAATAVKDFGNDVSSHSDKMEKTFAAQGLHVKDKSGALLSNSAIVENLFNATGGDMSKMGGVDGHVGMGRESIRIMDALKTQYNQGRNELAAKNPKATEKELVAAGAKRARSEVEKFENASYSKKDVERDFSDVTEGAGKRIEMASQRIRAALEVKMAPVVERLADSFIKNEKGVTAFVEAIGKAAEFMLDNPWKGAGIIMAASISKEIATAGIGAALKMAVEKNAAAAGKFSAAMGIASAAALAMAVGMQIIDDAMAKKAKGQGDAATAGTSATEARAKLLAKVRDGSATPEEKQQALSEARGALAATKASYAKQQADGDPENRGTVETAVGAVGAALSPDMADAQQTEEAARRQSLERTLKSMQDLQVAVNASTIALARHARTAAAADPANPNRNGSHASQPRGGTEK
jgi:hypothetical protein